MHAICRRIAARRDFLAFERAVRRAQRHGGLTDLYVAYRRA